MSSKLDGFLKDLGLQKYDTILKEYGIDSVQDISMLTPEDWERLKILPFHRTKLIQRAGLLREMEFNKFKEAGIMCNYKFSSSGPYAGDHSPESIKNFQPSGQGLTNTNDSWMKFTFLKPVKIYGVIIGVNIGVSGWWNNTQLQGVQIQVRQQNTDAWKAVATISGMPNTARTAYLGTINSSNVKEVRLWKNSWFSTSYIHFV